jgi:acyl-CoA reductase-like NAD-dependent aldehyde dehydrogenase
MALLAGTRSGRESGNPAVRLPSGAMLTITNPANGEPLAQIAEDTADVVARKYAAARAAQPAWAATPLAARLAAIRAFREAIVRDTDKLAAILTSEVGKPIRQSRNELAGLLGRIDFFLEQTESTLAPKQVFDADGMREVIAHEPLGVVANISAWNYPYFVGANVFVPALLTGNAVLYKPSEFATLTGLEIGRLLHASGVPGDVFAVVVGGGSTGAALLQQPVDGVFFTGSYATGARIAQAAGTRFVKLQLELGGKDPTYVCEDVDVAAAAASLADGAMYNTGQSCCSVERIYVHAKIHDEFVAAFVREVQGFRLGEPTDEASYIGPLTRAPQVVVLERQVQDARDKGARVLTGGARLDRPGNWFAPTVLVNVGHTMEVMREESFGPVIGIQAVGSDEEAIRLMNDTRYGLTAGVYTKDEARAIKVLAQVRAGSVYWNCCDRVSPRLPWSGVGDSGVGLTLSTCGIETFTRTKAWHLRRP